MKEKYTYDEMQGALPDYLFNRLPAKEREVFENTLPNFPDIEEELKSAQAVFKKAEEMDIDGIIARRARNLSVKVNNRLSEKKNSSRFANASRLLLPTVGVIAILVLIVVDVFDFGTLFKKGDTVTAVSYEESFTGLTSEDIESTIGETAEYDAIYEAASDISPTFESEMNEYLVSLDEAAISEIYEEAIQEAVSSEGTENYGVGGVAFRSEYDIYDNLDQFSEEDIQYILEEIENADFTS